jgi:hypothetical protein
MHTLFYFRVLDKLAGVIFKETALPGLSLYRNGIVSDSFVWSQIYRSLFVVSQNDASLFVGSRNDGGRFVEKTK